MIKVIVSILPFLFLSCSPQQKTVSDSTDAFQKQILLCEQSQHRIAIADVAQQKIIWEWKAEQSDIQPEHIKWFTNPSDAKPVYGGKYILTTASGGGVALIRIADKKAVFYAYAGGNPHSAELLPDGNIVSASSTGNYLLLFKVDTTVAAENVWSKKIPIAFGHNVVWDAKHQLLWSAAMDHMKSFKYNFNCATPDLIIVDSLSLPGTEAHDLFPIYGTDSLWLTNTTHVYQFSTNTKKPAQAHTVQSNIKSVSSGPKDFPVIIIQPKEKWWTDEVWDAKGNTIFKQAGLRIYKARWMLPNVFGYAKNNTLKICR